MGDLGVLGCEKVGWFGWGKLSVKIWGEFSWVDLWWWFGFFGEWRANARPKDEIGELLSKEGSAQTEGQEAKRPPRGGGLGAARRHGDVGWAVSPAEAQSLMVVGRMPTLRFSRF